MIKAGKMFWEVLRHLLAKPATVNYPFDKAEMPPEFRGKIKFMSENCIGCKLCVRDCPSNAITISKVGEKRFEATFALDKCLYCAQCVDSCNKNALASSVEFELAQLDRGKLKVIFHAEALPKTESPPAPLPPEGESS